MGNNCNYKLYWEQSAEIQHNHIILYINTHKLKTINNAIESISIAFDLLYKKGRQLDVDVSIIIEGFDESIDSFIMESSLELSSLFDKDDVKISKGKKYERISTHDNFSLKK